MAPKPFSFYRSGFYLPIFSCVEGLLSLSLRKLNHIVFPVLFLGVFPLFFLLNFMTNRPFEVEVNTRVNLFHPSSIILIAKGWAMVV